MSENLREAGFPPLISKTSRCYAQINAIATEKLVETLLFLGMLA